MSGYKEKAMKESLPNEHRERVRLREVLPGEGNGLFGRIRFLHIGFGSTEAASRPSWFAVLPLAGRGRERGPTTPLSPPMDGGAGRESRR
jgi:hypothetical protein